MVDKARDEPRLWSRPELEELIERVISQACHRRGASSIRAGIRKIVRETTPSIPRKLGE